MGARGVLFALSDDEADQLSEAADDAAILEVLAEIEERWDKKWLTETDKAWDAMHRALTDGRLEYDNGEYPLKLAILGGLQLHEGDCYIAALTTEDEVPDVARALARVDRQALRAGYDRIDPADYDHEPNDRDFDYTWSYFESVAALYRRAAAAGRAVVFTADL